MINNIFKQYAEAYCTAEHEQGITLDNVTYGAESIFRFQGDDARLAVRTEMHGIFYNLINYTYAVAYDPDKSGLFSDYLDGAAEAYIDYGDEGLIGYLDEYYNIVAGKRANTIGFNRIFLSVQSISEAGPLDTLYASLLNPLFFVCLDTMAYAAGHLDEGSQAHCSYQYMKSLEGYERETYEEEYKVLQGVLRDMHLDYVILSRPLDFTALTSPETPDYTDDDYANRIMSLFDADDEAEADEPTTDALDGEDPEILEQLAEELAAVRSDGSERDYVFDDFEF